MKLCTVRPIRDIALAVACVGGLLCMIISQLSDLRTAVTAIRAVLEATPTPRLTTPTRTPIIQQ